MKQINAIKIGNVINVSIDGKLHKKVCSSSEDARKFYDLIEIAKANPIDENIKNLRSFLNEKTRVAMIAGLENDPETGEIYLGGFNTPIPNILVDVIMEYCTNGYPLDAIINFWKLLMLNPDKRIRETLFKFITTHDFVLTDMGYMVTYKAVYRINNDEVDTHLSEFVSNKYLWVKKKWNCSPHKYVVYLDNNNDFQITKKETAERWNETNEGEKQIIGNLGELFNEIFNSNVPETNDIPHYTDMHTQRMDIVLGKPVIKLRFECDGDPEIECSYGLHVGATKYVESFASHNSVILVCLVNPANVVAVPKYDNSKIRVSEYFPFALATFENRKIDIIEQPYFENDYSVYESHELESLITKIISEELPIESAMGVDDEERPMSELRKIIESRLIDITLPF